MAVKPLSLTDIEDQETGSIWVLNTASYSEHRLDGDVLMRILPNAAGKGAYAAIPQSWLPFEITSKFSRAQVLESTEFRSALHEGLLTAISAADATAMLNEDGAREERQRLRAFEQRVNAARANRPSVGEITMDKESSNVTRTQVVGDTLVPNMVQGSAKGQDVDRMDQFSALFDRMKSSEDVMALNLFKMQGDTLKRSELRYIRDNLPGHAKLGRAVRARLAELAAERKAREGSATTAEE